MKKSRNIIIAACVMLLGLGLVKLYQSKVSVVSSPTNQILLENAERIKQVLAICKMDDDIQAFTQKAYNMLNEHANWHVTNKDILKENLELLQKIDEQWMDTIYQLILSLKNDSNSLRQEKKIAAIQLIASRLIKSNQDGLEEYVNSRMQQDGTSMVAKFSKVVSPQYESFRIKDLLSKDI